MRAATSTLRLRIVAFGNTHRAMNGGVVGAARTSADIQYSWLAAALARPAMSIAGES
jgi:hypothetical protein